MEHRDVIIVGAGLSGIGAAYHLTDKCPDRSYLLLESRQALGGTWDLFRYPGIRSDSDMHTLGYSFKPWESKKAIADGPAILKYVRETATENNIEQHIRYGHRLISASWCSKQSLWTLDIRQDNNDALVQMTCNFLYMCSGYYNYDQPHDPQFPEVESFKGTLVHPQFWPEDLDYQDKRVVIVGSGATAMTLLPAMTDKAKHVTMLQRSPTYVVTRPSEDWFANGLRKILPASWAYAITRVRNTLFQEVLFKQAQAFPETTKRFLIGQVRKKLGKDYDVDTHFTPRYFPWDQRLCLVPDDDLFNAVNSGSANVITDHIKRFTENGIELETGEQLEADIVISATGLRLLVMGGATFTVDGEAIDFANQTTYKGLMVSDVPNMVSIFGYINASWTLRADLAAEWVCRALNHMSSTQTTKVVPVVPEALKDMPTKDWIADFPAGYMQRSMHLQPRQGDQAPWVNSQNFRKERTLFAKPLASDKALHFSAVSNG
ncbi:MAG: NAD(P)/FAD-dependent oxidoreductase [Porticoccaceae bacterium]|nr:NAD(P)/FAD-dependent oxidoreductase [Porticoccaceae bacterium]